jgi:hypothetical protein
MSKRDLSSVASLIVVATPAPGGAGRFEARLDGHDRVLCVSRTPFFDAARELLAQGYDPNELHSATPAATQRRQGAINARARSCCFASDGSCTSCQFLLLGLTSFGDELRLDHFRNQIVLVAR